MKLYDACKIAVGCGLETIGEAIMNIELHSSSIFSYEELTDELDELYKDFELICQGKDDILIKKYFSEIFDDEYECLITLNNGMEDEEYEKFGY